MAMSDSEREMPFLEHLEELRWRIFKALIAFVLGMIICFIFAKQLLNVLTYPTTLLNPPLNLQVLKVQGMFIVYIEIGFFGGVIFALPVILYQFWSFISPGLKPDERRYFIPLLGSATLLFLLGVSFAYFGIMPYALRFFIGLAPTEIDPNIAIDFYIGFIIRLMLLFGLVFEMPVISYFLGKIGLIDTALMKKYRRHA
ncbi:twin-arginine translocase subunit TatC, partial [Candidatus Saccharibacteria bacterium]|nr:twin-arginine translocase subunit TatC [Candidatus Dadabacteria bacterium]NIV97689.1 twin-arginine translocase subunit TatC [Candidatus Saccharibacteria bacterium]NIW77994.1 twin-arginine translocase subunit TatC [Calditrichia bacterium]